MKSVYFVLIPTLVIVLPNLAVAELYKCSENGKITYQAKPCRNKSAEKQVDIEISNPERNAKALERLKEVEADYQAKKEQEALREKAQHEAALRAAEVKALERNANAQVDQSEAMRKQVKELDSAENVRGSIVGEKLR
ncbi:hypothetical protein ACQE3E_11770 [Methylomonas sp. MED-D]|uniref:hypothetical protein n=1 Tax=unclassified Methylomonas TaxID=2608980 RepID=UPI0008D92688|nr:MULTISPECIES: hypothetical protein [unclassified Methylomonas]MDT4328340.1 hypothetical protein [Methylomonas sp. MV1]NJA06346.1 hypothetical protein [Methylococcaceae bacterium WWC4]OHX37229.1 hypothetical protein BJL95_21435 [Methylomonas sp. LWB]WGS88360.1 hypothetical protein QC632_11500 [Methylomonas sp. UP202]